MTNFYKNGVKRAKTNEPIFAGLLGYLIGRRERDGDESNSEKAIIALFALALAAVFGAGLWGMIELGGWKWGPLIAGVVLFCVWFLFTEKPVGTILFLFFVLPASIAVTVRFTFGFPAFLSQNVAITVVWLIIGSIFLLVPRAVRDN